MQLWQMDVMGGVELSGGTEAKVVTGIDDHSRFCVAAGLVTRAISKAVCEVLAASLGRWGVPDEILTDNGKVFTGRFGPQPVEVLFDRICRENGISHRHTGVRSPTTTGKIERFHQSLRREFLADRTFPSIQAAQTALDDWVVDFRLGDPADGGLRLHSRAHPPIDEKSQMPTEPGAINGGLTPRTTETPTPRIVIQVDSIDESLKKIEAEGGSTVSPRSQMPGMGAYAYFKDTEGNLLGLWETL